MSRDHINYSWNSGYWWLRIQFRKRLGQAGHDPVAVEVDRKSGAIAYVFDLQDSRSPEASCYNEHGWWTMGVTLAPDIAARLLEAAARTGVNENEMANALLATALDLEGLGSESEVAAISEGLRACDEGRERRFSEFIAEHKSKYPASGL